MTETANSSVGLALATTLFFFCVVVCAYFNFNSENTTISYSKTTLVNTLLLESYKYEVIKPLKLVAFDPRNADHQLAFLMLTNSEKIRQHPSLRFDFDTNLYTNVIDSMKADIFEAFIDKDVVKKEREFRNGFRVVSTTSPIRLGTRPLSQTRY